MIRGKTTRPTRHGVVEVETQNFASLQGIAAINVRNVPAGVYVLRVTDENGREYHSKIVVR